MLRDEKLAPGTSLTESGHTSDLSGFLPQTYVSDRKLPSPPTPSQGLDASAPEDRKNKWKGALANDVQWLKCLPKHQRVKGLILYQGQVPELQV